MSFRLFDWLTKRNSRTPWIEEDKFIKVENEANKNNNDMEINSNVDEKQDISPNSQGRELIDEFLRKDFEPIGYQDALIDSDGSYAESNKKILQYKLELIIDRVLTYYNDKLKDYDFHIKTRKENGMMDTVEEIESEKEKVLEEIKKIEAILIEAKENKGIGYISILSYDRGFKRGLAAITSAKIFGKQISDE